MPRKTFKILKRTVIILVVMAGLLIVSLKLLGRSGEALKEGVENFMSETSGMKAQIGALSQSEFFPNVHISMQDVIFSDFIGLEKEKMKIESLSFSMPFYTFLLGNHAAEFFSLKGFESKKEVLTPHSFIIDKGQIEVEQETSKSYLSFSGKYAGEPLRVSIEAVSRSSYSGKTLYRIADISAISLTMGDIVLEGTLGGGEGGAILKSALMRAKGKNWGPEDIQIKGEENLFSCLLETAGALKQTEKKCTKYFRDNETK